MNVAAASRPSRLNLAGGNRYRRGPVWKQRLDAGLRLCRLCLLLTLALGLLAALSVGLLAAYRWTTSNSYFALSEVVVQGTDVLDYGEVVALSGLEPGRNTLELNMQAVRGALMQNPWVRAVQVKRELPDTVRITVHERRAAFLVPQEGTLWYADLEGTLIAPVDPNRFRSLPQLVVEQAEGQALVGPSDMGVLARDLRAAGLPFGLDDAAWVRLSYGAGLELEISGRVLSIGLDGWDENLQRLRAVWQDLERRGELAGIRSIRAHGNRVCAVRAHG